MKLRKLIGAAAVAAAFATPALAQTTATEVQRNVNQQERIEQGLKSGQLTTREAAKLEGAESRVEKMESRALKDGKLSPEERARIDRAQNQVSRDIYREKHDAQVNLNSPSSQRSRPDVRATQRKRHGSSRRRVGCPRTARSASLNAARRATTWRSGPRRPRRPRRPGTSSAASRARSQQSATIARRTLRRGPDADSRGTEGSAWGLFTREA
jgi:hypothetical protein